ncbi:CDP-alcohol phosphatidyltransferase family protein [Alicyclobacillus cycloheptanicus]|nr:CDP-alcohol phosphatidyltransferase family protein [Alicyclobacillus cycloheptanicus]
MTEFQKIYRCAKRPIDIWTNYLYYTISLRIVYLVRNVRAVTPNGITLFSLFLALVGCVFYGLGSRPDVVTGLILVQVSYVFDCADGQLARYRKQYSSIGGWLDMIADRVKEFAVYFSLAYGYTRLHPGAAQVWMWAMVALFALYVLEYYGQVSMFKAPPRSANPADMSQPPDLRDEARSAAAPSPERGTPSEDDSFTRMQRWRSFIPFRGFIIGEQYFAMLVFLAFGAIYPYFVFVAVLGLLMCVYRPVVQAVKHRRAAL